MDVGKRIKERRKELGLSAEQVAERLNVSPSTIYRYESKDIKNMGIEKIAPIAKVLQTTPGYLMGWEENSNDQSNTDIKASLPSNVKPYTTQKLPLLGTIACGEPILAEENISRYIDVVDTIKADFCLECKGDSMIGARIHDGDIVCIRMGVEVLNGQIAAVRINTGCGFDEATLKRVYMYPDRIVLQAENPAFPPLIYEKEEMNDVDIIGKAVAFISTVH